MPIDLPLFLFLHFSSWNISHILIVGGLSLFQRILQTILKTDITAYNKDIEAILSLEDENHDLIRAAHNAFKNYVYLPEQDKRDLRAQIGKVAEFSTSPEMWYRSRSSHICLLFRPEWDRYHGVHTFKGRRPEPLPTRFVPHLVRWIQREQDHYGIDKLSQMHMYLAVRFQCFGLGVRINFTDSDVLDNTVHCYLGVTVNRLSKWFWNPTTTSFDTSKCT